MSSTNNENNNNKPTVWYFETPNPLWLLLCSMIVYVSLLAYLPDVIPFEKLGSFGTFTKYLYTDHKLLTIFIFWAMWGSHFLEAIYVVKLATSMNLSKRCLNRWFFQTLFVGYPSTRLMLNYVKKQKTN